MGALAFHAETLIPPCCKEERLVKANDKDVDEPEQWHSDVEERAKKQADRVMVKPVKESTTPELFSDQSTSAASESVAKLEDACPSSSAPAESRSDVDVSVCLSAEQPTAPVQDAKGGAPPEEPAVAQAEPVQDPADPEEPVYHDNQLEQANCSLTQLLAQAREAELEAEKAAAEAERQKNEAAQAEAAKAAAAAKKKAALAAEAKKKARHQQQEKEKKKKDDEAAAAAAAAAKKAAEEAEAENRRIEEEARRRADEEKMRAESEKKAEEERKEEAKAKKGKPDEKSQPKRTSTGGRMPMGWRNKARGSKRQSSANPAAVGRH